MAKTKKQTGRGRNQDRARVAGGQDYEVRYEAKKTHSSKAAVKKAVKKVGNSRKRVDKRLGDRPIGCQTNHHAREVSSRGYDAPLRD
jgi:hypothetical protein